MAEAKKAAAPAAAPKKAQQAAPEVDPKDVDTTGKTEQQVNDELAGIEPVEEPETRPEPVDDTPPAAAYVVEPDKPVTMADVAAINGIGLAPDASRVVTVGEKDVFISEGMRNDLELNGWTVDPATGKKVVRA